MAGKVVIIADQVAHWSAGTEGQMLLLGQGLAAAGWTVPLVVLRDSAPVRDGRWPGDVTIADITSLASPRSWLKGLRLAVGLRRDGFRVVQLFFNDTSILLPPLLRLCGIKVVVARRDMGFWHTPGQLGVLRLVRRAVNRVVANSHAVAERVCETEGYSPDRVDVCYNGLSAAGDASDLSEPPTDGIPRPVVGLVANIRPVKRIDDAVKSFAMVAGRHPAAQLRIIGGGDASVLQTLADNLGIGSRVVFRGQVADAGAEIRRFSVAMLTSESEGLSNAVIEYMQAGKPVVCTDTGGNPELVSDGETGYLCAVGDIDAMANRLNAFLSDQTLRIRMGDAGRRRIAALCDRQSMVDTHAALYERLIGGRAGNGSAEAMAGRS